MLHDSVALGRYLQRHIESGLPDPGISTPRWHNTLVIPAYREEAELVQRLQQLGAGSGKTLVILVLNRPDSDPDPDANAALRTALHSLPLAQQAAPPEIRSLNSHTELYLHDTELHSGALPASQGVGLARKIGCDIALHWMHCGAIGGEWICSTDADAQLPPDYFAQLPDNKGRAVATVFPFRHIPGPDPLCNAATSLYELRLHHYVLGLVYAGSPYAYHTLGSCLAIQAQAYAQVRGFGKRAGAEDFYLLNKLAKLGDISRPGGECIQLQSRYSQRAPFGTGPAVAKIAEAERPRRVPLFYHPACFDALRALIVSLPALRADPHADLHRALCDAGLEAALACACLEVLTSMELEKALQHCHRQGKSTQQFQRQFHQWFDGFRTLKFIHGLRDAGWPLQSLVELDALPGAFWPGGDTTNDERLAAIRQQLGWLAS